MFSESVGWKSATASTLRFERLPNAGMGIESAFNYFLFESFFYIYKQTLFFVTVTFIYIKASDL